MTMIDPQLRRRAKVFRALMANQDERKIRRMRRIEGAIGRYAQRRAISGIQRQTEWIPRADGTQLRVVVYSPLEPQSGVAGVLYLHGGGYALGSPDLEAVGCRALIEQSDCVVVSPDYRLSTEAPTRRPWKIATPRCSGCGTTPNAWACAATSWSYSVAAPAAV